MSREQVHAMSLANGGMRPVAIAVGRRSDRDWLTTVVMEAVA